MLGAADVYNLLPEYIVKANSTKEFQHRLQELLIVAANESLHQWQDLFSPRQALHAHTVKKWFGWEGCAAPMTNVQNTGVVNNGCVTAWLRFGA